MWPRRKTDDEVELSAEARLRIVERKLRFLGYVVPVLCVLAAVTSVLTALVLLQLKNSVDKKSAVRNSQLCDVTNLPGADSNPILKRLRDELRCGPVLLPAGPTASPKASAGAARVSSSPPNIVVRPSVLVVPVPGGSTTIVVPSPSPSPRASTSRPSAGLSGRPTASRSATPSPTAAPTSPPLCVNVIVKGCLGL